MSGRNPSASLPHVEGGTPASPRSTAAWLRSPSPSHLLGAAVVASAVLLLVLGSHLSFMGDDWGFLLDRRGWTVHSLLDPNNEHIALIPVVIYKLLQETFGMSSA